MKMTTIKTRLRTTTKTIPTTKKYLKAEGTVKTQIMVKNTNYNKIVKSKKLSQNIKSINLTIDVCFVYNLFR